MFDLLAWSWEYEPLDLAGYIPDFVIKFERPLLVEVKPITLLDGPSFADKQKIDAGESDIEVLILGAVLHESSFDVIAGWTLRHDWCSADAGELVCDQTALSWYRDHWTPVRSFPYSAFDGCRAGGCRPTDHNYVHRGIHFDDRVRLIQLWREAGNRVQWRSR